jgi:methylmalonyl-CoA/ethylmalonyl-CoA epimerase
MSSGASASPSSFHLGEIGQVAITVSDLARSKDFYQHVLGLPFLFDAGGMAFFKCGKIRFALGSSDKPVSPSGTILYFHVPDMQKAHAELVSRGVEFVQAPNLVARMPDHDLWIAFLKDPDNNPVGLMCEVHHAVPPAR